MAYKNNHSSKWIKDLNIRPETIKLLKENAVSKLPDLSLGKQLGGFNTKNLREGSGTPLKYSCLKNPADGGAW